MTNIKKISSVRYQTDGPYWCPAEGKPIKFSDLKLDHLVNVIKFQAEMLDGSALGPVRDRYDKDLLALQAELDSRGPEIDKLQSLFRGLMRNV